MCLSKSDTHRGLNGSNILVLKEKDVKIITDLMMGGDGTNINGEIGELHLSAISEAMNQMMVLPPHLFRLCSIVLSISALLSQRLLI